MGPLQLTELIGGDAAAGGDVNGITAQSAFTDERQESAIAPIGHGLPMRRLNNESQQLCPYRFKLPDTFRSQRKTSCSLLWGMFNLGSATIQ